MPTAIHEFELLNGGRTRLVVLSGTAADEGSTPADRPDLEAFLGAVRSLDGADLRGSRRGLDGRVFRISSV